MRACFFRSLFLFSSRIYLLATSLLPPCYLLATPLLPPCYPSCYLLPTFFLLSCYYLATILLPSSYYLVTYFLLASLNIPLMLLHRTLDVPSPYLPRTLDVPCHYFVFTKRINPLQIILYYTITFSRICNSAEKKSREFVARTPFACYRRDARIPTTEKSCAKPRECKSFHRRKSRYVVRNILSLCDNGSCKLPFSDAAEFGNSAELRGVENSLSFSRICNSAEKKVGNLSLELRSLATEGTQEFPPLKKVVLSRGNARVSTAEKVVMLCITFCRFATMGVTNSRFLMLPNSEIRQN